MIRNVLLTEHITSKPMVQVVSFLAGCQQKSGPGLLDLSIGNPDLPPSAEVIEALVGASRDPSIHGYGKFGGHPALKQRIIEYYRTRYNVSIGPDELIVVRGIRSMIFTIAALFAGTDDYVLLPSISYPSYYLAADLAGARTCLIDVDESSDYMPDVSTIPEDILRKTAILFLNYPNNPTGAAATKPILQQAVNCAKEYGFLICYDNAYNEIVFDGREPLSILEADGARDTGIEMFSLSKLASLAGWRIAFCAGGSGIIEQVHQLQSLTDTAPYDGFQLAAASALEEATTGLRGEAIARHYQERRDKLAHVLGRAGISYYLPQGGMYLWAKSPDGDGMEFTRFLFDTKRVLVTPGCYYGDSGAGHVRFSLAAPQEVFDEALLRLGTL